MFSQSRSITKIALCLTAMLTAPHITRAQIANVHKRYRSKLDYNKSKEFGRKQRHRRGQQQQKHNENNLRKLDDLTMPPQESEFDMSVPSKPIVRMMSIPLQESAFDLSMPMGDIPAQTDGDDLEVVSLANGGDSDDSGTLLASFLAGISALVVGSVVFFVKMRQKPRCHAEEIQQEREEMKRREASFSSDMQSRMVSFASWDEPNIEGEMRDISTI